MAKNESAVKVTLFDALGRTTDMELPASDGASISYSYDPASQAAFKEFSGVLAYTPVSGSWAGELVLVGFTGYYDDKRELWLESALIQDAGGPLIQLEAGKIPFQFDRVMNSTPQLINALGIDATGNSSANRLSGGRVADVLAGENGNDALKGAGGNDTLDGGRGNDRIWGGAGGDVLIGQAGADVFEYHRLGESSVELSGRDSLRGFDKDDLIDLHWIDANRERAGNNAFRFIGDADFHDRAGEVRAGNGVISADVDGDGLADFRIEVANGATLHAGDFVL